MKNCHKAAENAKIHAILSTRKQLLVSDENIAIRDWLKYFRTPHMIRSTLMPSICKSELVWPSYGLCEITTSFLWNAFFALSFIMHYAEYFSMCHYAGFSQIGSHFCQNLLIIDHWTDTDCTLIWHAMLEY